MLLDIIFDEMILAWVISPSQKSYQKIWICSNEIASRQHTLQLSRAKPPSRPRKVVSEPEEQLHCTLPSRTFRSFGTSSNATVPCYLPVLSDSQSNINPLWRREEIWQEKKKKKNRKWYRNIQELYQLLFSWGTILVKLLVKKKIFTSPNFKTKTPQKTTGTWCSASGFFWRPATSIWALTAGEISQFLSFSLLFAQRSEMIQWNNGNPKQWKNGDPKHYLIQTSPKEHTFSNIGFSMLLNSYLFKKNKISQHIDQDRWHRPEVPTRFSSRCHSAMPCWHWKILGQAKWKGVKLKIPWNSQQQCRKTKKNTGCGKSLFFSNSTNSSIGPQRKKQKKNDPLSVSFQLLWIAQIEAWYHYRHHHICRGATNGSRQGWWAVSTTYHLHGNDPSLVDEVTSRQTARCQAGPKLFAAPGRPKPPHLAAWICCETVKGVENRWKKSHVEMVETNKPDQS